MERNRRSKTSRKVEYILWEDIAYSLFYLEHKIHIFLLIFSCQVITNSFQFCGPQHARLPCPPLTSQSLLRFMSIELVMISNHLILSNHLIIYHPLLLLPSIFPSIRGLFSEAALCIMWPNYWASASVLPMNIQSWFPLGLTGLISLLSKALSRVFSSVTVGKHQFFSTQSSLWSNFHICTWLLEKP